MQAATSAPFGPANMPLVLVRAMQAVKTHRARGFGKQRAGEGGRLRWR